jgi:hypothetical protein
MYYKETIQLSDRKFWRIIPVLIGLIIIIEMVFDDSVRFNLTSGLGMLSILSATLLLSYLISNLKLKIKITSKGIHYRMFPFLKKKRVVKWKDIQSCSVVESPVGTTVDRRLIVNIIERKITLTGNNGISIITKSGDRYLIGSKNPEDLKSALLRAVKSKSPRT